MTAIPDFEQALNSALDLSSSQVPFDALTKRYSGKKVWVIDREKIRQQVAHVVDSALAASDAENDPASAGARQRVAEALNGLFHDTRNIASQHDAETIEKMRAMIAAAAQAGSTAAPGATDANVADQIGRLTGVVEHAESLIAAMQAALRNVESGGAAPRRRLVVTSAPSINLEQASVLREIFESNLELRRSMSKTTSQQPRPQPKPQPTPQPKPITTS